MSFCLTCNKFLGFFIFLGVFCRYEIIFFLLGVENAKCAEHCGKMASCLRLL